MSELSEAEILRLAAQIRGKKGGQSRSEKKQLAARKSIEIARKARAEKHKKEKKCTNPTK